MRRGKGSGTVSGRVATARHEFPVTVFGPDPLLSVTIEAGDGEDEMHVHVAGQGVWGGANGS
jgi:hypothetical protein